jgi:secondary thiamine-phosphate synthase enzyme
MKSFTVKTSSDVEFVDITGRVKEHVSASKVGEGICLVYVPHTTAGVTINEAADPSVKQDMIKELNKIVPFSDSYRHMEGNSAAHIKTTLTGSSVQLPVSGGRLVTGTWQGIYLCEFDGPRSRTVSVQILGS